MDGARGIVGDLVRQKLIELRRVEIVGRDLAAHCTSLGRRPAPRELETWLEDHAQVEELFASEEQLAVALDKYLPLPKPPPANVRDPELERQILLDDGPEPVAVYADWLQERGDPFGDQLALALAGEAANDDRFHRWVHTNKQAVLGPDVRGIAPLGFKWLHGFVHTIDDTHGTTLDYRPVDPARWAALLRVRSCSLVRTLRFMRPISDQIDAAIAEAAPPSLHGVAIGHVEGSKPPRHISRLPLQVLHVSASSFEISADTFSPTIVNLQLSCRDARVGDERRIVLPRLRALEVGASAAMAAFVRCLDLPKLERLTIVPYWDNGMFVDDHTKFEGIPGYVPRSRSVRDGA